MGLGRWLKRKDPISHSSGGSDKSKRAGGRGRGTSGNLGKNRGSEGAVRVEDEGVGSG